jgi:hypothetical protein
MTAVLDALWRASAYCLHPWVVLWALLPTLLVAALTLALGYFHWETAVDFVRATVEGWALSAALLLWLESLGAQTLRALAAPLIVVALAVPVIVVLTLLLVALLALPPLVALVARRRFAALERRRGAGPAWVVLRVLGLSALALLVLAASVPLWLIPPLALVLPPLVLALLAVQLLAWGALAAHASADERRAVLGGRRRSLGVMGLVVALLIAVASLPWAAGALALVFAPLLAVVAIVLYALVFVFAGLWFIHYLLAALQALRAAAAAAPEPGGTAGLLPPPAPAADPPAAAGPLPRSTP